MEERLQHDIAGASETPLDQGARTAYAFNSVISRYETALLRYVGQMIGPGALEDAEDLVQEAFLRLHKQVTEHGESSVRNLSTWLFRVAHNLVIDAIRRRRRNDRNPKAAAGEARNVTTRSGDKVDALGEMMQREASERALAELHKLPEEQKHVILLRIIHGLTFQEIGEVTGLTIGNVSYRISQGLQELAQRLKASRVI